MMVSKRGLGWNIKLAREEKSEDLGYKYTQGIFAADLGLTQGHISDIESGRTYPSVSVLVAIAKALGVTVEFLLRNGANEGITEEGFDDIDIYPASNIPQVFNYGNSRVRLVTIDGEPWFVGKDVADALGYSNSRAALMKHVDDEDKADVAIHDGSQNRGMVIINESGLYSLIMSSKLSTAKKFKRWVTHEVLPAIRKTGTYSVAEQANQSQLLAAVKPQLQEIQKQISKANQEIDFLKYQIEDHTIDSRLQDEIKRAIRERVYSLPGPNYLKLKDFHQIHKDLKEFFKIRSFKDVRLIDYEKSIRFIERWNPATKNKDKPQA